MIDPRQRSKSEKLGEAYFFEVLKLLEACHGSFGVEGQKYFIDLGDGERVVLDFRHDNLELANLLLETCNASTFSTAAKICVQRLLLEAQAAVRMQAMEEAEKEELNG